ncbi:Fic family protein [Angustibacter sp. McL0619]|uniref:Fic family protein n=1 Tax=Angustibacter sp. McL0619 TaxID=3415676 RepID=UPI003CEF8F17
MRLSRIDTGRGREELFRNQLPALLTELAVRARVASITASSALEGVVVPDQARAAQIIDGKVATLRNRSEQEFAGYRVALDYLFSEDWRPLNVGLLLHLHRKLFEYTELSGGTFKVSDNLVVDRSPDGTHEVRFVPVPASRTEFYVTELITRYDAELNKGEHHRILLIGLFILDLLTIHPFDDGNGRVVRALTNALLADAGYGVGKYVSLEQLLATTADDYYAALLASTHGWHEQQHDPWPWLSYFVTTLSSAYETFELRAASDRSTGTKQDRVREYVLHHAPMLFKIADVRIALPGISDPTIRLELTAMRDDGLISPEGTGRSAMWRRHPQSR